MESKTSAYDSPLVTKHSVLGIKHRKFQDELAAILFLIAIALFCYIAFWAYSNWNSVSAFHDSNRNDTEAEKFMQDIKNLPTVLFVIVCASILWIQVLNFFTTAFVYLTLAAGVFVCFWCGYNVANFSNNITAGISFWVLGVVFIVFIQRKWASVQVTVKMFAAGAHSLSKAWKGMLYCVFVVIIGTGLHVVYFSFSPMLLGQRHGVEVKTSNTLYWIVFTFIYFWISSFITGLLQTTLADAICVSLYNQEEAGISSLLRALYSFGSIALGSLLLNLTSFIRYVVGDTKKEGFSFAKCCFGCCITQGMRKLSRFLSHYSYIIVAKEGKSFLISCVTVLDLFKRNTITFQLNDGFGGFILFLGKSVTSVCALIYSIRNGHVTAQFSYVAVFIVSWVVNNYFVRMMTMSIDATLLLYLEDPQLNIDSELKGFVEGKEVEQDTDLIFDLEFDV
ncbi:hypothetical protein RCL1_006969 [Eukaryota sp. TZLM3-RCL]